MNTSSSWYYVDSSGQQQGPVSAAVIAGHARQGKLSEDSLLWREGLPSWVPLSALRTELGLPPAAAPAPAHPTAESAEEPQAARAHTASAQADPPAAPAPTQPYAPPSARLEVPEHHRAMRDADVVPAGFLRRWAALFIDYLILGIAYQIIQVFVGIFAAVGAASMLSGDPTGSALFGIVFIGLGLLYFVMAGLYFSLMESSAKQATVGKMALGIKVTDMAGRRLGFGHALGRWVAAALSYLTLWIGFLMAAFTERKRALHDFVADTQVVDRWAYTDYPERQQRGLSGCLVAILVAMALLLIMTMGILLAVAIPAYQDYVQRASGRGAMLHEASPGQVQASSARPFHPRIELS